MAEPGFVAGPEGGDGASPSSGSAPFREKLTDFLQRAAVIIPVGLDAYLLYAFCYLIVWHRVRFHNQNAAIAILVIFGWVNLHLIIAWVAIYAWGSGRITDRYISPSENDEDGPFICNEQGYSLYCSHCQRVKPNRAHHSKFTDTCVPQMDHFCPWIGTVIGQGNLKFFLQFCFSAFAGMIVTLVTLFVYQHQQVPYINGNSIAMYVICGITIMFTGILATGHVVYLMQSQTTLESISYGKGRLPYINLMWRDGQRRVIQPEKKDVRFPRPSPFTQGRWTNFRTVMGPIYTWTLPIRGPIFEPQFNTQFIALMRSRIDERETQEQAEKSSSP